jgi:YggT family protein
MYTALSIVDLLLSVLLWIIIIQAVLSWLVAFNVINTHNDFVRQVLSALNQITEPLYRPIRRIMPDFGALDFSPMVVMLLIIICRKIIEANMGGMITA